MPCMHRFAARCLPLWVLGCSNAWGAVRFPCVHIQLISNSRCSFQPCGQVRSSLGQAGDLATETAALLSMEQVQDDDQFTPEVNNYTWLVLVNLCNMHQTAGARRRPVYVRGVDGCRLPCLSNAVQTAKQHVLPPLRSCRPAAGEPAIHLPPPNAPRASRRCWRACPPRPGASVRRSWPSAATSGKAFLALGDAPVDEAWAPA